MRDASFYPGSPCPPSLPRAPMSGPAPFPQFSPTPPRLQGYQRPQIQVKKMVWDIGKNRVLSFLTFRDKKSARTGRCWPRPPSPCPGTSTPPRISTRASGSASCRSDFAPWVRRGTDLNPTAGPRSSDTQVWHASRGDSRPGGAGGILQDVQTKAD